MISPQDIMNYRETTFNVFHKGEKLKLIKNTKGYQWEIVLDVACPQTMKEINDKMIELFGELE